MLNQLFATIEARKAAMPEGSYTAHLLAGGEEEILRKVREECAEVIQAADRQGSQRLVEELADLFYHLLVLLAARELSLGDVEAELRQRHVADG